MTMKRVFLQFCSIVQFTGVLSVIVLLLLWPARLSSRRWLKSERACVCVLARVPVRLRLRVCVKCLRRTDDDNDDTTVNEEKVHKRTILFRQS